MRAVVWHGKEDVRVDDVPEPTILEPTDAIVEVTSTAICGSDLHLYGPLSMAMEAGDILGHESMGIVRALGDDVTHVREGDRVVVPFNISCGECFFCTQDLYSQCETTRDTGTKAETASLLGRGKGASLFGYTHLYGAVPGGQAQFVRVPQAHTGLIPVPDGPADHRYLFLSDVLPTAWQAVAYADTAEGDTAAVWGLGPVGQMAARVARHRGARLIATPTVPARLELAPRHGTDTPAARGSDDPAEAVREMTAGRGADCVIDAVGMEASGSKADSVMTATKVQIDKTHVLRDSMRSVRRGGTLSLSGVYGGPVQMFPLGDLFDMQVQVRMGQANVLRWVPEIIPLLTDDDPLGVDDLVTHRLPLRRAPEAYEMFRDKTDGCIKVVLDPAA